MLHNYYIYYKDLILKKMRKIFYLTIALTLVLACNNDDDNSPIQTDQNKYDETSDGDLSNDHTVPSAIIITTGNNRIMSTQSSNDVDYLTFTVPAGNVLSEVIVDAYTSDDSVAFIGISQGASFPVDASNRDASNLLGGALYGPSNVGSNILPEIGMLPESQGFSGGLPAGDYSIWLNQTGANSSSTITLAIDTVFSPILIWEDEFNGDLSDDHTAPTGSFVLNDNGMYEVDAVHQGAPRDVDYFTFVIPSGKQLSQIVLDFYDVVDPANLSFIGIVSGNSFPNDANSTTAGDLLGGKTFGVSDEGNDILQDMGTLPGATGFTGPLPSGTYSIWFNQTGDVADTDIILVVTDESLSTTKFNLEDTTSLFPNPALNKITISSKNKIQSYSITDVSGRIVLPLKQVNTVSTTVNLSVLNKGLYFANILTSKGVISKKIIKK